MLLCIVYTIQLSMRSTSREHSNTHYQKVNGGMRQYVKVLSTQPIQLFSNQIQTDGQTDGQTDNLFYIEAAG